MKRFILTMALVVLVPSVVWAQSTVTVAPVEGTPADAESNTEPFLARIGMRGYFFNGATWDRMRGDTTSGLWVNVKNASIAVTGTFFQATQPVSGTVTANMGTVTADPFGANADAASATGSISAKLRFIASTGIPITGTVAATQSGAWSLSANQSVNVAQLAGATTDTNSGNKSAGTLRVVLATDQPALTNKLLVTPDSVALPANQSVNVAQMNGVTTTMGNGTAGTGVQRVAIASDNTAFESIPVATASTTNGTSTCYITSAASTNSTNCKASAGNVYEYHVTNTTTTNYFLRLYNASSAPTCSSATGFIETIPALGATANGGVNGRVNVIPQSFTTGIGFCLTGGGSSTDNTNAATGVYVTIGYK